MGRSAKMRAARRDERRVRNHLEAAGVGERVRAAVVGLRREDVQADIRANEPSLGMVQASREALERRGYDLSGVGVTVEFVPGKFVVTESGPEQLPPTAVITADASPEFVAAARAAIGARPAARAEARPN